MTKLSLKDFMKKYDLKDDSMKEGELKKVYNYNSYRRDSKITTDKGFVDIDNGAEGETHCTCFYKKDNKSFYFDSFGARPDKFLLQQLPKPKTFHYYKIQDIISRLCGTYRLYFLYLI